MPLDTTEIAATTRPRGFTVTSLTVLQSPDNAERFVKKLMLTGGKKTSQRATLVEIYNVSLHVESSEGT